MVSILIVFFSKDARISCEVVKQIIDTTAEPWMPYFVGIRANDWFKYLLWCKIKNWITCV